MAASKHSESGRIFSPYRAIGLCCNHVPLCMFAKGDNIVLTTAVGKAYHFYNCDKLRLLFVGDREDEDIQCLAMNGKCVFTGSGNSVKIWRRGRKVAELKGHTSSVQFLLLFGEHLISVDTSSHVRVSHFRSTELYGELTFDPSQFEVTALTHPSTYLNKILFGSRQGQLQLWNIRTSKLIHSFQGWGSPVLALEQSPALDVVGIGLGNGTCVLHNLKFDQTLMDFHQEWGPVTAISFRTDGTAAMATASTCGEIAVWDLDHRRLATIIRGAHDGRVTGLRFVPSQPLLLTSSPDNSIKMWIFDQSDSSARVLKFRSGHGAPPSRIRFCTKGGQGILSAGLDRSLRFFTTVKDSSALELSQGSIVKEARLKSVRVEELRLPPIVDFAVENIRGDDWDSVVTCHAGPRSVAARTWHLHHRALGQHKLKSKFVQEGTKPTCVCVTGCGNFTILGMSGGHIEMYNLQSGLARGVFGGGKAHAKTVRGISVDSMNMEVFSGSADSTVKVWSFRDKNCLATVNVGAPVAMTSYHRESSLLAAVCDDFVVRIIDTDNRRIVRLFAGHTNQITDVAFMADAHWLVTSSVDSTVRTWDLFSGRLLDCFLVDSPVTSLALSPVGEYLVTTHVDDCGIYLWTNHTLFSHVSLKPLPAGYQPPRMALPESGSLEEDRIEKDDYVEDSTMSEKEESETEEEEEEEDDDDDKENDRAPLGNGLVTLSSLPPSHWASLPNLELIKERNKPKEPPKAARNAPFFLQTKPGLTVQFLREDVIPEDELSSKSKIINVADAHLSTAFQACLKECHKAQDYTAAMDSLQKLGPSAVDAEIKALSPEEVGSTDLLSAMLDFFVFWLKKRTEFEVLQAYLNVFLKVHGLTIKQDKGLVGLTREVLLEQRKCWSEIESQFNKCSCLIDYFKSATV